jgi:hypothetical protein
MAFAIAVPSLALCRYRRKHSHNLSVIDCDCDCRYSLSLLGAQSRACCSTSYSPLNNCSASAAMRSLVVHPTIVAFPRPWATQPTSGVLQRHVRPRCPSCGTPSLTEVPSSACFSEGNLFVGVLHGRASLNSQNRAAFTAQLGTDLGVGS